MTAARKDSATEKLKALTDAIHADPHPAELYLERANLFLAERKITAAIADYEMVIKLAPSVEVFYKLGKAYHSSQDFPNAINYYDKALEFDKDQVHPLRAALFLERGETFTSLKKYQAALISFKTSILLKPSLEAYRGAGKVCNILGDQEKNEKNKEGRLKAIFLEAVSYFDEALVIDPKNKEILCRRGYANYGYERYFKAILDFEAVLEMDPESSFALGMLGSTWCAVNKFEKAIENFRSLFELGNNKKVPDNKVIKTAMDGFEKIIHKQPNYVDTYFVRASLLIKQKDYAGATNDYLKVMQLNSEHVGAPYQLGLLYLKQEKYHQAIEYLTRALRLDPNMYEAQLELGNALYAVGEFQKATTNFNAFIQSKPADARVNKALGKMNVLSKNWSDAKVHFDLCTLDPEVLLYQGLIACEQLEINQALHHSIAANQYPFLVKEFKSQTDLAEAENLLVRGLKHDPNNYQAHLYLGLIYLLQKNMVQAINEFSQVILARPESAEAYLGRANAYFAQGDYTQALEDYNQCLSKFASPSSSPIAETCASYVAAAGCGSLLIRYLSNDQALKQTVAEDLAQLLKQKTNDHTILLIRARTLCRLKLPEADQELARLIESDPNHAEAHYLLAKNALARGQIAQAIKFYQRATALSDAFTDPFFQGIAACWNGDMRSALLFLQKATESASQASFEGTAILLQFQAFASFCLEDKKQCENDLNSAKAFNKSNAIETLPFIQCLLKCENISLIRRIAFARLVNRKFDEPVDLTTEINQLEAIEKKGPEIYAALVIAQGLMHQEATARINVRRLFKTWLPSDVPSYLRKPLLETMMDEKCWFIKDEILDKPEKKLKEELIQILEKSDDLEFKIYGLLQVILGEETGLGKIIGGIRSFMRPLAAVPTMFTARTCAETAAKYLETALSSHPFKLDKDSGTVKAVREHCLKDPHFPENLLKGNFNHLYLLIQPHIPSAEAVKTYQPKK